MNAGAVTRAEDALIFTWGPPRRRKRALILLLFLSALLHALCFYLFQIVYPPTISLMPPPARVSVISPNTEEGRVLLRWIEAEDPALASTTQRSADAKSFALPRLQHVPSYLTAQPTLKEFPATESKANVPSSAPPGPVRFPRAHPAAVAKVFPTTIDFGFSAETKLEPLTRSPLKFKTAANEPPQEAQFRIAIAPQGEVRFCLVQRSSGDPALDEEARAYIAACRFPPREKAADSDDARVLWTIATVNWGNDISVPPAAPERNLAP